MSRTGATKATGFEDHLSEFVTKLETGPRMNQYVKARGPTNTQNIDSPNLSS